MRVNGLGAGVNQQPSLGHPVDQLPHVVTEVGAVVARAQDADDVVHRAFSVAQLEYLRRARVEAHGALGDEQQVLLAHVVVAQTRAGDKAGPRHDSIPPASGGVEFWESPRSMASSCAHSTSVLNFNA